MNAEHKKKPNRLFQGLIAVSLGIHVVIFLYVTGVYRSNALTCIELSMRDISKPLTRSIPRPRVRSKAPKLSEVHKINVSKPVMPSVTVDPVNKQLPDTLMAGISMPGSSESGGWDSLGAEGNYLSSNDYFDMVRLKIENNKQYPEDAKSNSIEGRVKVSFVITPDGQVSSLNIAESSRHASLDAAALEAVRNSSPFPPPPRKFFNKPILVEIAILFNLT